LPPRPASGRRAYPPRAQGITRRGHLDARQSDRGCQLFSSARADVRQTKLTESSRPVPRPAAVNEAAVVAQLLHDFNREFEEPTPPVDQLAERLAELIASGDSVVLLVGESADGLAVLRFRPAIWSSGLECYLAELYVRPSRRGHGLGRALMTAALREARARGADTMEIGVDEPDLVARRLYESLGFSNRSAGGAGASMYLYELDLRPLSEKTPREHRR